MYLSTGCRVIGELFSLCRKDKTVLEFYLKVDSNSIESIKADLTKYFKNVKSSHRVEALARALGFNTYAALRAEIQKETSGKVLLNWVSFRAYLEEKGYNDVIARPLFLAAGRATIRCIMKEYPLLTYEGVGIDPYHYKGIALQDYQKVFFGFRDEMLLDENIEQFLRSYVFVSKIEKTKSITDNNSYFLKHIAEKFSFTYPDGVTSQPKGVFNGSLIFAAIHAGFKIREWAGSQNVSFNMKKRSIHDLDRLIRPYRYKDKNIYTH
jgi:hypothetical protein